MWTLGYVEGHLGTIQREPNCLGEMASELNYPVKDRKHSEILTCLTLIRVFALVNNNNSNIHDKYKIIQNYLCSPKKTF